MTVVDPHLPIGIDQLRVDRLKVGEAVIGLSFHRHDGRVSVTADAPPGMVRVHGPEG